MMRLLTLGLAALFLASCAGPTVPPQNLPPAGTIWFGTALGPSYALAGRSTSAVPGPGHVIALVAHLNRRANGEIVRLLLDDAGQPLSWPIGQNVVGEVVSAVLPIEVFPQIGTLDVKAVDGAGNILAEGAVVIT